MPQVSVVDKKEKVESEDPKALAISGSDQAPSTDSSHQAKLRRLHHVTQKDLQKKPSALDLRARRAFRTNSCQDGFCRAVY